MNNIHYTTKLPDIDDFFELYESTGWNDKAQRPKELLLGALENSWYFVSVYDGDRLTGCGRIISDGYLHAFITEMIVSSEYRMKGIGKDILKQLVKRALECGIKDIQLFCAKGMEGFYLKNGFEKRPDNAPGMQYKIQ